MNEQQYRIIADKLRDYAAKHVNEPGIQVVYEAEVLLRDVLERSASAAATELLAAGEFQDPHPPTREQIAEVFLRAMRSKTGVHPSGDLVSAVTDAVLALIRNGAD